MVMFLYNNGRYMVRTGFLWVLMLVMVTLIAGTAQAELYNRAPDVSPGTLPGMRNPGYWVARMDDPEGVVLSVTEIEALNGRFRERMTAPDPFGALPEERKPDVSYWWPGLVWNFPDLTDDSPTAVADTVRTRIATQIEYLRNGEWGYIQAVPYRPATIDALVGEMNEDAVPGRISVRDGIAVRTTRLRNVPSELPWQQGIRENAKTRWDMWNVGVLHIAQPVTILHVSRSGEYLLVLCDIGYGWAKAEDIAIGTRGQMRGFAEAADFVIALDHRVLLYADRDCTMASGWFGMGDKLPLAAGNMTRQVFVPVRKSDGEFITETCWLAEDALVSAGYQPYTRRNIVETAFRLLDMPYDFTGGWLLRQHETTYRDIFATFGIRLPMYGTLFTFYGDNEEIMQPDIGKEAQYRMILEHEPFVTLQSCGGHAQLLLGELDGTPIAFDQHGYGYEDEDGNFLEQRRCNIGTVDTPGYFLQRGVTFTEIK